jgi:hypothetical protein
MQSEATAHAQPPGAAAQRYLGACADTRKAWYSTSMLSRARPQQMLRVRQELASGDARRIAHLLCDMSGPMHPGAAVRAQDPMTRSGVALARNVVQAVLDAVLSSPVEASTSAGIDAQSGEAARTEPAERTQQERQTAHLEELKRQMTFWIDHGRLRGEELDRQFPQPRQIAQFLAEQATRNDKSDPAMLRLACVALTAPAVESAWVISRLSDAFLDAQRAAHSAWPDPSQQADLFGGSARDTDPGAGGSASNLSGSAMERDAQDEKASQEAIDALNRIRGLSL